VAGTGSGKAKNVDEGVEEGGIDGNSAVEETVEDTTCFGLGIGYD